MVDARPRRGRAKAGRAKAGHAKAGRRSGGAWLAVAGATDGPMRTDLANGSWWAGLCPGRGGGKLAGLPEGEQVPEPVEQAGESGEDEGLQHRDRPAACGQAACVAVHAGGEAGNVLGQGGRGIY